MTMKKAAILLFTIFASFSFAQEKEELEASKKSNNYIYQGNTLIDDDFVSAKWLIGKQYQNSQPR